MTGCYNVKKIFTLKRNADFIVVVKENNNDFLFKVTSFLEVKFAIIIVFERVGSEPKVTHIILCANG